MSTNFKDILKNREAARKHKEWSPDVIYDEDGNFMGYKPKSMGFPVESVTGGASGAVSPSPRQDRSLGSRIWQDLSETVSDIKDEPGEVPYRIRERVKDYFKSRGLKHVAPKGRE